MKNIIYTVIIIIFLIPEILPAKNIVVIGFKDDDPKTRFISTAFSKFLKQNLEEAGFDIKEDKSQGLTYELLKQGNFFLASKEFFDQYENIDLDNSITGTLSYKGRYINLNIQVYSREKRRLVLKGEIKGDRRTLLTFFSQATKNILTSMDSGAEVKNIFPIDDNKFLYPYLKLNYQAERLFETESHDDYFAILDQLEILKDKFDIYPAFKEIYDDLISQKEDYERPGPFNKPFENISKDTNSDDSVIEGFAREIIANGYRIYFSKMDKIPVPDEPEILNLVLYFDVKFKRSYKKKLIDEIKERDGNPHFTDMGRFFFSKDNRESSEFRDFILLQRFILRFYNEYDEILFEEEKEIYTSDYSGGAYRHSKNLPVPLTPRGPANAAFGIDDHTRLKFFFKDIEKSKIDRVVKSDIEIIFD